MTKRDKIDLFLKALDEFLINNEDLQKLIIPLFKANKDLSKEVSQWKRKKIEIPNLVRLINIEWQVKRKSFFAQRIAYWLKWVEIEDNSYQMIFNKLLMKEWYKVWIKIEDFKYKPNMEKYLIPEDFWELEKWIYIFN